MGRKPTLSGPLEKITINMPRAVVLKAKTLALLDNTTLASVLTTAFNEHVKTLSADRRKFLDATAKQAEASE